MFSATTRVCPTCTCLIPDPPAVPKCTGCGRLACVHHTQWPMSLKWFLLASFLHTLLMPWMTEQELWETLLRQRMVPDGKKPNRNGTHLTVSTPMSELYAPAIELTEQWKSSGSPIVGANDVVPAPLTPKGSIARTA